jgi:bacterioferritin
VAKAKARGRLKDIIGFRFLYASLQALYPIANAIAWCSSRSSMKGNPKIIDLLNEALTNELTAINQYFLHARMCKNWGYEHLGAHIYKESIDEMKHADKIVERILYLDGLPNLQRLGKLSIGTTPVEILKNDLALEMLAIPMFNAHIQACRDLGDNGTEDLFTHILVSEEEHVDWLESQLELVKQLGEVQYLTQQIRS